MKPPQTTALRRRAEEAIAARRERRAAKPRRLAGVRRYLAIIGPGLIVANAGNDAGGIFTYSNTGSKYGLGLLWTFLPILLALIVVQEMVARLGSVTGKGLMDLIRERFGVRWTLFASVVVIVANGGTVLAEFAGIGGALDLLGVPLPIACLGSALMLGILVLRANRRLVERVFLAMGLTFVSYIITTVMVHPNWGHVAHSLLPSLAHSPIQPGATSYTADLVTLVGTSITPYMQLFLQSSIVDKGTGEKELNYARADVISGSTFAMAVAACIVITTAYTLFPHGFAGHDLGSAGDAASALAPLAGEHATQLFAIGLLGASLLAAAVLPLSTAFVVCEAFGAERSVQNRFGEAPLFFGLFILLLAVGAATVTLLGTSSIAAVAIGTQTLDGVLLPVLLVFILFLANDRRLLGRYRNGPVKNAIAVAFTVVLGALSAYLVLSTFVPL